MVRNIIHVTYYSFFDIMLQMEGAEMNETVISKNDRRVDRTLNSIRTAFTDLLSEKDIGHITIKELSERADINRKTFYMHYTGISDLVRSIEDELVEQFLRILKGTDFFSPDFNVYRLMDSFNDVICHNLLLYKKLLSSEYGHFFIDELKTRLKQYLIEKYRDYLTLDEITLPLYAEYVASGIIALYSCWFNDDRGIDIGRLSTIAGDIIMNGISSFMKR